MSQRSFDKALRGITASKHRALGVVSTSDGLELLVVVKQEVNAAEGSSLFKLFLFYEHLLLTSGPGVAGPLMFSM